MSFLMFEELLPPLPSSPASSISQLDFQFSSLDMSSNTPTITTEAPPPASSNVVTSLPVSAHLGLIKCLETFGTNVSNALDSGYLSHHCLSFEGMVVVCSQFCCLSIIFLSGRFAVELAHYQQI